MQFPKHGQSSPVKKSFNRESPTDAQAQPQLLSVAEAAIVLACSESNVYALIESGDLPYVQIGKAKGYRIDVVDILAFIAERKKQKRCVKPNAPRTRLKHIKI